MALGVKGRLDSNNSSREAILQCVLERLPTGCRMFLKKYTGQEWARLIRQSMPLVKSAGDTALGHHSGSTQVREATGEELLFLSV